MDRVVSYIQYMPIKPIKHGIKVYACCGIYTVLLGFKIFVGKEDDSENTVMNVCDELCKKVGLTGIKGRTLYTDNYYTSMKLAKYTFENYHLIIVGTMNTTDKKLRQDRNFPYLKLSNGARNKLGCGWY